MEGIHKLITDLKKDIGYKTWVLQFKNTVERKDRIPVLIKYFLVYDLDDKTYSIKSEYQVTYNMIVLQTAIIPSKKDVKTGITIEDYKW